MTANSFHNKPYRFVSLTYINGRDIFLETLVTNCSKPDNSEKKITIVEKYVQYVTSQDSESNAILIDDNYLGVKPSYGDLIRKSASLENREDNITYLCDRIAYNKSKKAAFTITEGDNKGKWASNSAI